MSSKRKRIVKRPKLEGPGRRINVWIPEHHLKAAYKIENLSAFFQIALMSAPEIMAWAILKDIDPKVYDTGVKLEDNLEAFNKKYPQDPLTQKRTGKWPKPSQNIQDVL